MTLLSNKVLAKNEMAFSLIDAMVRMAVLGLVMFSLFASFTSGFNVVRITREDLRATQVLNEKMETIRLYNWDQVIDTNFIPTKFSENRCRKAPPVVEVSAPNYSSIYLVGS